MYPWLRVMYAVVVMGSRIRRSACGTNLSTFCPCANAGGVLSTAAMASAPITAVIECNSEKRLFIAKSPATNAGGTTRQCLVGLCLGCSIENSKGGDPGG